MTLKHISNDTKPTSTVGLHATARTGYVLSIGPYIVDGEGEVEGGDEGGVEAKEEGLLGGGIEEDHRLRLQLVRESAVPSRAPTAHKLRQVHSLPLPQKLRVRSH